MKKYLLLALIAFVAVTASSQKPTTQKSRVQSRSQLPVMQLMQTKNQPVQAFGKDFDKIAFAGRNVDKKLSAGAYAAMKDLRVVNAKSITASPRRAGTVQAEYTGGW